MAAPTSFDLIRAVGDLTQMMKPADLELLIEMLRRVREESGYGTVSLVVADRRLMLIKCEVSRRSSEVLK